MMLCLLFLCPGTSVQLDYGFPFLNEAIEKYLNTTMFTRGARQRTKLPTRGYFWCLVAKLHRKRGHLSLLTEKINIWWEIDCTSFSIQFLNLTISPIANRRNVANQLTARTMFKTVDKNFASLRQSKEDYIAHQYIQNRWQSLRQSKECCNRLPSTRPSAKDLVEE